MATPKAAEPESREQAAESGAALVQVPHGVARLQRPPVVNTIDEKTLALIASQIAPGCSRGEIGHFLELCAHYDLDPFAKEAWCAKGRGSDNARLLIMVGRDGLRKIAQRQGLEIDGDVVRERDTFTVTRNADRSRSIEHAYAETHAERQATPLGGLLAERHRRRSQGLG
ncbi:MAG: recombinase RecT, partial [Solirubrobacteraceae bacterium]